MSIWRLAVLNLTRRKMTTLIAMTSIAIAVGASGILLKLYLLSDSRFATLGRGGDAVIGAKSGNLDILLGSLNLEGEYPDYIPLVLYESLRSEQPVAFADGNVAPTGFSRLVIPFVYFGNYDGYRVIGTDRSFLSRPVPADEVKISDGKWAELPGEAVIGSEVARRKGLRVGDQLTVLPWTKSTSSGPAFSLKVVGLLQTTDSAWDRAVYSNLDQAQAVIEKNLDKTQTIWGAKVLNYFLVYLRNDASLIGLNNLINRRTVAQVISVPRELAKLRELTGTGREIGFFMTALIMFLGGLSVTAVMVTRFDSMSVQLAVLRAIGYGRRQVSEWLLIEGFILGLCAATVGAAIDAVGFPLTRSFLGTALPPETVIDISFFASWPIWLTALIATTLAIFIPLVRLYRQDVHDALLN